MSGAVSSQPSTSEEVMVKGLIGAYGLQHWWLDSFTPGYRASMVKAYKPAGMPDRCLTEGNVTARDSSMFSFLVNTAVWFNKPGFEICAAGFLDLATEFLDDEMPVLDRHFAMYKLCETYYRMRDAVPEALEKCLTYTDMYVSFHEEVAYAFLEKNENLPHHPGFTRLRLQAEKDGNFQRALELCRTARDAGWQDDWDGHIARIENMQTQLA